MTASVAIVDYGAGNLRSVANALYLAGAEPEVAATPETLAGAERIVLPGVGAAGHAIARLRASGMADALDAARARGTPILGICLGLQMMAQRLDEFGSHAGLGWIPGRVGPIEEAVTVPCRVPHTGWSAIETTPRAEGLIGNGAKDRTVYFCHSNCLTTDAAIVAATVDLGTPVTAAIRHENLLAVQFHPEKSQQAGARLLQAFLDWTP